MSNKLSEDYIRQRLKEIFTKSPNITLENAIKKVYADDKEICEAMLNVMNVYNKNEN